MKVEFTKRAKKDLENNIKGNKNIAINIIKILDGLENGADIYKFDIKDIKGHLNEIKYIRVNDYRML